MTNSSIALTKENLDKLVSQFESKIEQLEKDPKSVKKVDRNWRNFRNRFYDIRRDDRYLEEQINIHHSWSCPEKCIHGKSENNISDSFCEMTCQDTIENGICSVHGYCICEIDCDCYELCSVDTDSSEIFLHKSGVKSLIYHEINNNPDISHNIPYLSYTFRYAESSPINPEQDPYMLRGRQISIDNNVYKMVLSLNSIPILEKNIERLNKEIIRQESHRWTMAKIRSSQLLNSYWTVLNHNDERVLIDVPNEIIILICYYLDF